MPGSRPRVGGTMTDTANNAPGTADRDLGGCPVKHLDFSAAASLATYWNGGDVLRGTARVFFTSFPQGLWVFPRHDAVRDIYRDTDRFCSESFTPWEPNPVY